jgi:hypothetical protein
MGNEATKLEAEKERLQMGLAIDGYRADVAKQRLAITEANNRIARMRDLAAKNLNVASMTSNYALVVNCTTLKDSSRGWKFTVHDPHLRAWLNANLSGADAGVVSASLPSADPLADDEVAPSISWRFSIIGVMGFYDRGKTFVLNNLCGRQWISSKRHATEGLSFAIVDEDVGHWIILDTAGFGSPLPLVQAVSMEATNDLYAQSQAMEFFLRDLTFTLSQILLLVVSDLTISDQKFIDMIQNRIDEDRAVRRNLIVIHNLKDVSSAEDYDLVWNRQIEGRFRGAREELELRAVNHSTKMESKGKVRFLRAQRATHLVVVNDNCEFGEQSNAFTFAFLRTLVNSFGGNSVDGIELPRLLETACSHYGRVYTSNVDSMTCRKYVDKSTGATEFGIFATTTDRGDVKLTEWQMDPYSKQVVFSPKLRGVTSLMGYSWWVHRHSEGKLDYLLTLYAPGVDRNDVKFRLREGVLTATADIPTGVPAESVESTLSNGVIVPRGQISMEIRLPPDAVQQLNLISRLPNQDQYRGLLVLKIPQYEGEDDEFAS